VTAAHKTITTEAAHIDLALLLLRIASAPAFLYHGSAILFAWFGGAGPAAFASSHHWPLLIAYLVGAAQVGGGLAILTGILWRLGAASVLVVMVGAILLVHLPNGFNVENGGVEYAFAQLLIAGALLLMGPGRYSLEILAPPSVRRF
jgi:putative oxidoreductase